MAIESNCKNCGQKLSVEDEHLGKQARCPACGDVYVVAAESEVSPFDLTVDATRADAGGSASAQPEDAFWMKSAEGAEYGPVDRETLNRWFTEGRVAENYAIRQGANGSWQSADAFQSASAAPAGGNPYVSTSQPGFAAARPVRSYVKPDQSGLILAMGILGFFVCGIFAIVAWVMGNGALKDIQAGLVDPENQGLVKVGKYLGMASCILHVVCVGGYITFIAVFVLANA